MLFPCEFASNRLQLSDLANLIAEHTLELSLLQKPMKASLNWNLPVGGWRRTFPLILQGLIAATDDSALIVQNRAFTHHEVSFKVPFADVRRFLDPGVHAKQFHSAQIVHFHVMGIVCAFCRRRQQTAWELVAFKAVSHAFCLRAVPCGAIMFRI